MVCMGSPKAHSLVPRPGKFPQITAVENPLAINPVMFFGGGWQSEAGNGERPPN
jgi:hypothetical protein